MEAMIAITLLLVGFLGTITLINRSVGLTRVVADSYVGSYLASEGVEQLSPLRFYWWLLIFPCTLLAVTLLSLNFLGDGLRDVFDPKKESAKI